MRQLQSNKTKIENAVITSMSISNTDYGALTIWIGLSYGDGSQQGFGGYCLYSGLKTDYTGKFIWRLFEIADVSEWSKLINKPICVKIEDCSVKAIGHFLKDDWFTPGTDLDKD